MGFAGIAPAPSEEVEQSLAGAAAASLVDSGYAALSAVTCRSAGDAIILKGSVPTYHLKQLAQVFVQRVDGVRQVINRLDVQRPGELQATP
jgi:osmotically-inducible protein OsmY